MPDLAETTDTIDNPIDDVRAAFETLSQDVPATAPASTPAAEPESPPQGAQEAPEGIQPRDEHGRFAPKGDKPELTVASAEKTVQAAPQQSQTAAPPEPRPSAETILPPQALSAPIKAKFSQLPPDVQQEFARFAEAVQTAKTEWDGKAQQFNELDRALTPVKQRLAMSGLSAGGYVQALITADEALRGPDKVGAILQVAQMYGIGAGDLAARLEQPGSQAPSSPADPVVATLQRQEQQIAQLSQALNGITSQQEERALGEARSEIAQMRSDPKFMYFDNVSQDMAALMEAGLATNLPDAYERACWANPQIRSLLQAQGQAAPQPQPQTRPAGVQVNGEATLGSAPASQAAPQSETPLESARRAYQELSGRA